MEIDGHVMWEGEASSLREETLIEVLGNYRMVCTDCGWEGRIEEAYSEVRKIGYYCPLCEFPTTLTEGKYSPLTPKRRDDNGKCDPPSILSDRDSTMKGAK